LTRSHGPVSCGKPATSVLGPCGGRPGPERRSQWPPCRGRRIGGQSVEEGSKYTSRCTFYGPHSVNKRPKFLPRREKEVLSWCQALLSHLRVVSAPESFGLSCSESVTPKIKRKTRHAAYSLAVIVCSPSSCLLYISRVRCGLEIRCGWFLIGPRVISRQLLCHRYVTPLTVRLFRVRNTGLFYLARIIYLVPIHREVFRANSKLYRQLRRKLLIGTKIKEV
jgi:hypothetical protein